MGSMPVEGSENSFSEYFNLRMLLCYFLYFLRVFFKIPDKHPCPFYMGVPLPGFKDTSHLPTCTGNS